MKKAPGPASEPGSHVITHLRADEALGIAVGMHQNGLLDDAAALYAKVLESEPGQPDALHFLGVLKHQMGESDKAIRLIRQALGRVPDHVGAWNNLGNVLKETGRTSEARAVYRRVLKLKPDHPDANCNLAVMARNAGRGKEAMAHLRRALEAAPEHADALYNLSLLLHDAGRFDEAAEAARRAVEAGHGSDAYENVATALCKAGRMDKAIDTVRKWLTIDPDNPVALHLLAAYQGERTPARAADDYVTRTFDEFASSFDTVLERIGYKAPNLVANALAKMLPEGGRLDTIVDAGCGTGLCGPLIRDRARCLLGVDLSAAMLAKARERDCYDELIESELTVWLAATRDAADAIVSADTLVYFGRLDEVINAAFGALKPGGALVFTVEVLDADDAAGYRLQLTGRYAHTAAYIERTVADAGFELPGIETSVLRTESREPVHGYLVTARRPGT